MQRSLITSRAGHGISRVEWDGASFLRFFLDSTLISEVRAGQTEPTRPPDNVQQGSTKWFPVFHADPMFLMLQTAVGGGWPGEPRDSTELPVHHRIDYVRYEVRADAQSSAEHKMCGGVLKCVWGCV